MSVKGHLRKWFIDGRLWFIGKPLYHSTIAVELALQRALDAFQTDIRLQDQTIINQHLTAVIKTFERPKVLKRLLASIQRMYPSLHIIVVDDSRNPVMFDGVQTIILPYDSGVSAGRNEGLKHVITKYVLILDDDFVFNRHTKLEPALAIMEHYPEIDIMGGQCINLPFFKTFNLSNSTEFLWPTEAKPTMPPGSHIGDLPVYNKVEQFFIGRTERIRLVGWDSAIKRIDHAVFFTRAKGVLTTVYNPNLKCLHAPTPFDKAYMQKRMDYTVDLKIINFQYNRSDYIVKKVEKKSDNTGKIG